MKQLETFTEREKDIMFLIAKRYSNQEIANSLVISVNTVKWYARNIYSKLGLTAEDDKRQATKKFVEQNLLPAYSSVLKGIAHHPLPFCGRENELMLMGEELANPNNRIISLLAPGGMGKTRLALQLAYQYQGLFPDGVAVVELHKQVDDLDFFAAICHKLGFRDYSESIDKRQHLLDYLGAKRLLLVIDNGEYLNNVNCVADLLKNTINLTILLTTRERLGLSSEIVHTLTGLEYPPTENADGFDSYPAIQFLVECIRRVQSTFKLHSENRKLAYKVVAITDGMPLAILIAAAWADTMPLDDIVQHIKESHELLTTELADIPSRQRSIQVVIESAWRKLEATEQRAYEQLSIFQGGFTIAAATAVVHVSHKTVKHLVQKALVTQEANGRLSIHELLRQFGEQRLQQSSDIAEVEKRYIRYFAEYVGQFTKSLAGNRQIDAFHQLDKEFENIIAGWKLAIQHHTYDELQQYMSVLLIYYHIRASQGERERLNASLEALFEKVPSHPVQASVLLWKNWSVAHNTWSETQIDQTRIDLCRAATIAHEYKQVVIQAYCEYRLGWLEMQLTNYTRAIQHFSQVIDIAEQHDLKAIAADGYVRRSSAKIRSGVPHNPKPALDKALRLYTLADDRLGLHTLYYLQAVYYKMMGEYRHSERCIETSMRLNKELGYPSDILCLNTRGHLYFLYGEFEQAKSCAQQADARSKDRDPRIRPAASTFLWGLLHCIEGNYEKAYDIFNHLYHLRPNPNPYSDAMNAYGLALTLIGLNDAENAKEMCAVALQFATQRHLYGRITWCLPVVAWLYAYQGQSERAIIALELANYHPKSASGWIEGWFLLQTLRKQLHQTVDEATYIAITKQAHQYDLMGLAQTALAFLSD